MIKVSLTLVGRSIMLEEVSPNKGKDIFTQAVEGRNIIVELFEGHEIRFLDEDVRWTVLPDVRNALGMARDTVGKIVKRIELLSPGCSRVDVASTLGETDPFKASQKVTLVNPTGLSLFFQQIDTERLQDPTVQDKCRRMQLWSAKLSGNVLTGDTVTATMEVLSDRFRQGDLRVQPFGEYFQQQMMVVEALKNVLHIDLNTSTCLALQKTEDKFKEDLSGYRALIPKVKLEDVPYLTPSDIATQLGYPSPQAVNKRLQIMGLQELVKEKVSKTGKETRFWRPTEGGKPHALFEAYAKNGHSGYQLRWKESILSLMKQYDIKHAFW